MKRLRNTLIGFLAGSVPPITTWFVMHSLAAELAVAITAVVCLAAGAVLGATS
jgi:heme O synthase-like polyprenyltransferase